MAIISQNSKVKSQKNVALLLNFEFLLLNWNHVRVIKKNIFKRG